jgi:hypothetical protein
MKPIPGFISMWGLALWGEAEWAFGVFPATASTNQPNRPDMSGGFADGLMSAGFNS